MNITTRRRGVLIFAALCLLEASRCPAAPDNPPTAGRGTLRVNIVLLDGMLGMHPVPLHSMKIVASAGVDTLRIRTSATGVAETTLSPGEFVLESVAAVAFMNRQFRWRIPIHITTGAVETVELTNDNATPIEETTPTGGRPGGGSANATQEIFTRLKSSVFRIEAGLGHGTGFLCDTLGGVILTNAHVVAAADSTMLSVTMDGTLRFPAQILARDETADVAVLRVHPSLLDGRYRIPLFDDRGRDPVVPGERLVAMGYPLHQELTITSGIEREHSKRWAVCSSWSRSVRERFARPSRIASRS